MNQIDIVEKYDDSFSQLNKRVLEIDSGILRYYSKVPAKFNASNPQMNDPPKTGILIASILDMIEDEPRVPNNLKIRSIIFTFYKSQLLSGKELFKSDANPKPIKQNDTVLTWIFVLPNEDVKSRWCETFALNLKRQQDQNPSVKNFIEANINRQEKLRPETVIEQQFQEHHDEDEKQRNEAKQRQEKFEQLRTNMKIQEMSRKQRDEEMNKQKKLQQEEEQKRMAIQKEEEDRRRREEENKQLRKEQERQMRMKIQTAWEFRFYQSQEDCLDQNENFDNSLKQGLKMIKFIETFKEQAFITVKQLICELLEKSIRKPTELSNSDDENEQKQTIFAKPKKKPQSSQKDNKLQEYVELITDCYKGEFLFKRNNMLILIATSESVETTLVTSVKSNVFKILEKYSDCNYFQEMGYFQTVVHSNKLKRNLSDEFKSLNYLNDLCYNLRSIDKNFRLKVPLSCQMEYLGFKALIIAQPPSSLDGSSLAYGQPKQESYYKSTGKLDREIETLGRTLAIKPHFFSWRPDGFKKLIIDNKRVGIFLSVSTQIHVGKFDEFEQLKALLRVFSEEEIDIFENRRQGLFYIHNTSQLLPFLIEESYSELIEILNVARTQQNSDFTEAPVLDFEFRRAKPEFLMIYFESGVNGQLKMQQQNVSRKLYNPDAYDTADESNETYADQLALAEMSKHFIRSHIQEFVNKLDQLEICPIDSYSLRESCRLFGINMHFLGIMAKMTKIPQIQNLCEQEMLARSIKNIFNQQYSEFILTIQEDQIPTKTVEQKKQSVVNYSENEEDFRQKPMMKKMSVILPMKIVQEKQTIGEYLEGQYKEMLADLLNLVFSKNTLFYEQILFKQVLFDFNYDMNLKIRGLNPGGLLAAICFNLKVDTDFEPKDIYYGTPYSQNESDSVIIKYQLKQYLHSKSYQQLFKANINQVQQSTSISPLPTPPTKGTRSIRPPKQGLFDGNSLVQLRFDVFSYQMQESEICKLINKFNIFKIQKNYALAIKVLQIRLNLIEGLSHTSSQTYAKSAILTDIAEMHLKLKQISHSLQKIASAMYEINQQIYVPSNNEGFADSFLTQLSNMNNRLLPKVGMIKPLMILLELVIEWYPDYVFVIFDLLIFNLEYSLGSQHHFYAKVFNTIAQYFQRKGQMDDHLIMFQMQIQCLIQTIGNQHQMTAEAYIEIGEKKSTIEEQINYYEKAYYIFETLYSDNSLQTAYVSCRLAKGYSDCGRIMEALKTSQLALKILKNKSQDNIVDILELLNLRGLNLLRNLQRDLSRKECEEFFNVLLVNWESIQQFDSNGDKINEQMREINVIPKQLVDLIQNTLRIFIEIFYTEMQREHRNFLYQMYDMVLETLARTNYLEIYDNQFQSQLAYVLRKIKQYGSIQSYMEWTLSLFVDKTGGDVNWLIFNFKAHGSDQLKEAYDNYENLIIAIGRKTLNDIFNKIFLIQS